MGSGGNTIFSNSALRVGRQGFGCTERTSIARGKSICRSEAWQRRGRAAHSERGRRILADAAGATGQRFSSIPCKWRVPMDGPSKTTMRPRSRSRSTVPSARSWSCSAPLLEQLVGGEQRRAPQRAAGDDGVGQDIVGPATRPHISERSQTPHALSAVGVPDFGGRIRLRQGLRAQTARTVGLSTIDVNHQSHPSMKWKNSTLEPKPGACRNRTRTRVHRHAHHPRLRRDRRMPPVAGSPERARRGAAEMGVPRTRRPAGRRRRRLCPC